MPSVAAQPSLVDPIHWYVERDPAARRLLMRAELVRRARLYERAEDDLKLRLGLIERARRDTQFFFDQFVFSFEPRQLKHYPMVLWPIQRRFVAFVEQAMADARHQPVDWLSDKSRDMGVTYLCIGIVTKHWRFVKGFQAGFCSNLERTVDTLGNPSSIFEKVRLVLDLMPWWMRPAGYDRDQDALYLRILNRENGNAIIGEKGEQAGRGGRCSIYVVDEAAFVDKADNVNRALSAVSNCRGWVSTANGMGNFFYRHRHGGGARVLTLHYRDHPWKDEEWAKAEEKRIGKQAFAAEVAIDYAGSVPSLCVELPWVEAAKELWRLLPHPTHDDRTAGVDVGAGKDLSIYQPRIGELAPKGESLQTPDTAQTALWALGLARQQNMKRLVYDSVGVGEGVKVTLNAATDGGLLRPSIHPTNWGLPASSGRLMEDGRTAAETFANLKAELVWLMRERFRRSYELWLHLTGQEGGVPHHQSDCILLEPNPELEAELCVVKWFRRGLKIEIERKEELKNRGIKSPDWFDALALSQHEPAVTVFTRETVLIGSRLESLELDI